jgi:hypothetical protein
VSNWLVVSVVPARGMFQMFAAFLVEAESGNFPSRVNCLWCQPPTSSLSQRRRQGQQLRQVCRKVLFFDFLFVDGSK